MSDFKKVYLKLDGITQETIIQFIKIAIDHGIEVDGYDPEKTTNEDFLPIVVDYTHDYNVIFVDETILNATYTDDREGLFSSERISFDEWLNVHSEIQAKEIQAKEFNECADLAQKDEFKAANEQYQKLLKDGVDPFAYMMKMQFDLQNNLSKNRPNIPFPDKLNTIGEKYDWLDFNKRAFDDEFSEIVDALPGMSMPSKDRSAVWKKWKSKYEDVRSMTFDDLSEKDKLELKFELADSFHFYMNMFFALDMSAEELFTFYYAKNAENHRRTQNGY